MNYTNLYDLFTAIANVIREKMPNYSNELLIADNFPTLIEELYDYAYEDGRQYGFIEGENSVVCEDRYDEGYQDGYQDGYDFGRQEAEMI